MTSYSGDRVEVRKPGQVANVSGCPWLQNKSPRKSRKRLQVSFPVFEQFSEETAAPFWKQFFMSIAYGKLPRGFAIRDEIYYRRGGKCHKISMSEPLERIIEFFQKHGGFHSTASQSNSSVNSLASSASQPSAPLGGFVGPDEKTALVSFDGQDRAMKSGVVAHPSSIADHAAIVPWPRLQKKQKDNLLELYAEECTTRYGFGFNEYQQLLQLLNISQILLLLDDRVRLSGGRIVSIQGLSIDVRRKKFFLGRLAPAPTAVVFSAAAASQLHSSHSSSTALGKQHQLYSVYRSWLKSYKSSLHSSGGSSMSAGSEFSFHSNPSVTDSHRSSRQTSSAESVSSAATHTTPLGTQLLQSSSSCMDTIWSNVLHEMKTLSTSSLTK